MANDITTPGGTFLGIYGGFSVVLVRKGDRYGLENCLTHEKDDPMVEFYDADYAGKPYFTKVGQFVSRYYLSTLTERPVAGLCLDGGIPKWSIAAGPLADALKAVKFALSF
jgi:hypothetical protein